MAGGEDLFLTARPLWIFRKNLVPVRQMRYNTRICHNDHLHGGLFYETYPHSEHGALALCLALTLSACSPKETLKKRHRQRLHGAGLHRRRSVAGGGSQRNDGPGRRRRDLPESMDTSEGKLVTQVEGDTMYVAFNGIQNRNTDYFVAASDSITVTGYATTESTNENYQTFKVALWQLSDDSTTTSYVTGSTIYYPTDGTNYSYTITGLTPGKQYKVNISYDSSSFYVTGGLKVQGLGSEELTAIEEE